MIVASDLNGTLTTGSPILAVARWVKKNQPEYYPPGFIGRLFLSYLQVKMGMVPIDTWGDKNMRRVLKLVHSPSPEILDQIMFEVARDELWAKRRKDSVEVLQDFYLAGAQIILISAAYEPAVKQFAALIGKDRTIGIGTPINLENGVIQLAEVITSREQKLRRLKELIGEAPIEVAMGDTFADIPLLEQANKAIAVYPDRALLKKALEMNWQIIGKG